MKWKIFVTILFSITIGKQLHGQTTVLGTMDRFIPRENTLFEDDFSNSLSDTFPSGWHIKPYNAKAYITGKYCHIDKEENKSALTIKCLERYNHSLDNFFSPAPDKFNYLPDSFTIQYDFYLYTPSATPVLYFGRNYDLEHIYIYHLDDNRWMAAASNMGNEYTSPIILADTPQFRKWLHFALSFSNRKLICYLGGKKILTINDYRYDPRKFMLSADGDGVVAITNVRVATGAYEVEGKERFDKLLMGKKFVTHAIHFDFGKSKIKSGNIGFINQLADWLKQNTSVKLEIDGHTDNDGMPAANIKLSKERAEAVKKQLILNGIAMNRLTAKGYGDTRPIDTNTTPNGKANNRRVEFIKL